MQPSHPRLTSAAATILHQCAGLARLTVRTTVFNWTRPFDCHQPTVSTGTAFVFAVQEEEECVVAAADTPTHDDKWYATNENDDDDKDGNDENDTDDTDDGTTSYPRRRFPRRRRRCFPSAKQTTGVRARRHFLLLTAYHVVAAAEHVGASFSALGRDRVDATVVACCPDIDAAVLRVSCDDMAQAYGCTTDDLMSRVHPLVLGTSDAVQIDDAVLAIGYPQGQESVKVTRGVISGRKDAWFQVDAPINPGNSGGPLLVTDATYGPAVVGIVVARQCHSEGMGYAMPMAHLVVRLCRLVPVAWWPTVRLGGAESVSSAAAWWHHSWMSWSNDVRPPASLSLPPLPLSAAVATDVSGTGQAPPPPPLPLYERLPALNFEFACTTRTLLESIGCPHLCGGVLVTHVIPKTLLHRAGMRRGDVFLHLAFWDPNGRVLAFSDVSHFGEVRVAWWSEPVPLPTLLLRLRLGVAFRARFWSRREQRVVQHDAVLDEADVRPLRALYPSLDPVDYETFGGMVVMPLYGNHVYGGGGGKFLGRRFRHLMHEPRSASEPRLLVTYVFPQCSVSPPDAIGCGDVLEEVNDVCVRTLDEYRRVLRQCLAEPPVAGQRSFLRWRTADGMTTCIDVQTAYAEHVSLMQAHGAPVSNLWTSAAANGAVGGVESESTLPPPYDAAGATMDTAHASPDVPAVFDLV